MKSFKNKLIEVNDNSWDKLKVVANYYGRKLPFVLDDAINSYCDKKFREMEQNND